MGKVIALILLAVSTKVNAEEELTNILADRAFGNILFNAHADLDDAMLAKPLMASGGVMSPTMTPSRVMVVPSAAQQRTKDGKRVFGGTNKLLAGQGKPCTNYDQTITEFGWFGAVGGARDREQSRKQQRVQQTKTKEGKKLFGGTNKLLAGQGKACTEYNNPITSFGWFGAVGNAKSRTSDTKRR